MNRMSVWKRYRSVAVGLMVAGASLAGCAPDFEEPSCQTDEDCFNDEMCIEGVCRLAGGGGGEDTIEADIEEDTAADTVTTDTDGGMDADGGGEAGGGEVAAVVLTPEMVEVAIEKTTRLKATVLDG